MKIRIVVTDAAYFSLSVCVDLKFLINKFIFNMEIKRYLNSINLTIMAGE